jgi:hypothetical protein
MSVRKSNDNQQSCVMLPIVLVAIEVAALMPSTLGSFGTQAKKQFSEWHVWSEGGFDGSAMLLDDALVHLNPVSWLGVHPHMWSLVLARGSNEQ